MHRELEGGGMTCIDCVYYSMWDGVCMNPVSDNLWQSCYGGNKEACRDFEEEKVEQEL